MQQSKLAVYLDLTDDQLDEMGLDEDIIHEDSGNSGEMVYSYYFNVPESTPQDILKNKSWKIGDRIELPLSLFNESDEPSYETESRETALEQALIAVIGAYRNAGGDLKTLTQQAQALILNHSEYRIADHPYVSEACAEIEKAVNYKK
ncbi:hypothetical protein PTT84_003032 [Cronobacter turicensis]|nr:hypothetical protein [Cronobacter turicensis]